MSRRKKSILFQKKNIKLSTDDLRAELLSDISGILPKLDLLYIMASDEETGVLTNEGSLAGFDLVKSGAPEFIPRQGYKGDDVSAALLTGYDPTTDGSSHVVASRSFGAYILDIGSAAGYVMGTYNNSSANAMNIQYSPDTFVRASMNANLDLNGEIPTSGFIIGNSINNEYKNYLDGVEKNSLTISTNISSRDIALLALGSTGVIGHGDATLSLAFVGGGLTTEEISTFNTAVSKFIGGL